MSNDSNNSKHNGSRPPAPKSGEPVGPKASEADYLAQQAVDARAAITRTLSAMGKDLGDAASVGALMRSHPWLTLGASTVAAFVATAAVVPSKEEQALRKLARIERALHPPPPRKDGTDETPGDGAKGYKSGRASFTRSLLGEVIKAVQPALLSMLTAGMTAAAARPSQEEMQAAAAAEDQSVPPTA